MKFAIKTNNGHFFCAEAGGGREIVANRKTPNGWELFEFAEYPDSNVAILACNNKYIAADNGGGKGLIADRDTVNGWELFKINKLGPGQFTLRACNGQYVCAENGGGEGVIVNRDKAEGWETFQLVVEIDGMKFDTSSASDLGAVGVIVKKMVQSMAAKAAGAWLFGVMVDLLSDKKDVNDWQREQDERDRREGRDWGAGRSSNPGHDGGQSSGVDDTRAGREEAGRTA